MGEGEKERRKRLSNAQLHLNQSSEPDSGSAPGYLLNAKAKDERRKTDAGRESATVSQPSCQTAITDGAGVACFYLYSQNSDTLSHILL